MAADAGDGFAREAAGILCSYLIDNDESDETDYCELGAKYGNTDRILKLGLRFEEEGTEESLKRAAELYGEAADLGDSKGFRRLGYLYEHGEGVAQSYEKAAEWYLKAAENGHSLAQFHLGSLYEKGNGVRRSIEDAKKWYRMSAEGGDSDASKALERIDPRWKERISS